jgi:hypothetical protein
MHIAQGGLDAAVAHQPLQTFHRQAGRQLMGGMGVAQAMDAADRGHTGRLLGVAESSLEGGRAEWPTAAPRA